MHHAKVLQNWENPERNNIMSKVSSSDYPSFTKGQVSINNQPVASASMSNGVINSNYNMSDAEKAAYDYAQNALASILPQLNVFSPEVQNSLQSQLDAYKNQGIKTIDSVYTPMIKSMENDIASRFGNFDNSIFMNNLNNIESKRSDAISSFAQDVLARQSQLENDELNRRYTLADFLNGVQNQSMQNALSMINTALGGSTSANSYNNNLYNSLYKQSLQNQSNTGDASLILAKALGLITGNSFI